MDNGPCVLYQELMRLENSEWMDVQMQKYVNEKTKSSEKEGQYNN